MTAERLRERMLRRLREKTVETPRGCWELTAHDPQYRYARIKTHGKHVRGHRLMWEITYGPIPPGLGVLHRCDNPKCINPEHLFLGTQEDNVHDAIAKGRFRYNTPTPRPKLTAALVAEIRRSPETHRTVALRYGVAIDTIRDVRRRRTWASVA